MDKSITELEASKIRSAFSNGIEYAKLRTEETNMLAEKMDSAIKKQIPRLVVAGTLGGHFICPACNRRMAIGNKHYCDKCGQKLAWVRNKLCT